MSKNAEGWIRHRAGRKCPVVAGVKVDYRMRSKKEAYGERAELLDWGLDTECPASDIMAYRLHKPAEQPKPFLDAVKAFSALAKFPQLDGPLQWRDRIEEIDVEVQALTVERAELVQKLASEGFALIGRVVESVEDMSDPKNWREGDCFVQTAEDLHGAKKGELWVMSQDDGTTAKAYVRENGDEWYVANSHLKFHSRPSA